MSKKRKRRTTKKTKPWCFYCDREFDNDKVLIDHQKAKHFKCSICSKKLGSASGMATHVYEVHKVNVDKVPNAKPGRDDVKYEIFGMDGIPEEFIWEHKGYSEEEIQRRKKIKLDAEEEKRQQEIMNDPNNPNNPAYIAYYNMIYAQTNPYQNPLAQQQQHTQQIQQPYGAQPTTNQNLSGNNTQTQ